MRSFTEILASAPVVDAPPQLSLTTELLEQTEIVGLRELHALALGLQQRKSEKHAMLGRALAKAVRGEVFFPEGQRNVLSYQLAGEIIEKFPFCIPSTVVALFGAALSLQGEPTEQDFERQLIHHQGRKQGKADTLRTLEGTLLGTAPIGPPPVPEPPPVIGQPEVLQRTLKDVIVMADGIYYLRHPTQDTYPLRMTSEKALRLELVNQFGQGNQTLNLIDSVGRMYPTENILTWYGCNAHTIHKSFAVDATRFDFATAQLSIGHVMISAQGATYDLQVETWLKEMAGGSDEALGELYEWIAATDQRYILRPAAAIAIVAPKDSGKSMLAKVIANTWGSAPIKLDNAVQQFNGSLQTNPVWHADEEMPKELTGHAFRELVQSRDRLIEPKGKEKVLIIGAPRLMITVNELADIKIRGANGPDAVAAISDRLAIFMPSPRTSAALEALRLPDDSDVDIARIVSHVRFVQVNFEPRRQRFLGARGDRSAAEAPILTEAAARAPQLFELLEQYLTNPQSIEQAYHLEERQFSTGGQRFPIVTQDGALWVRPGELSARLGLPNWQIEQSLMPFREGKDRPEISFGNRVFRARFWRLNIDRVITASEVEVMRAVQTVAVDTRTRNPKFA